MTLDLVPAEHSHVSEIGRIAYEAFRKIQEDHGFQPDFPDVDIARQVLGMMTERNDFYGVVALESGRPVGSNFLSLTDPVAGVGPITIAPTYQGKGIGRALMENVLAFARQREIARVRLLQESFNTASLSLYAALGFEVREAVALMQVVPVPGLNDPDARVRPVVEADLPAIDALSRRFYKTSRRNEVALAAPYGFPAFLREQQGRVTGYLLPGMLGHGVAETEEDALALIDAAACQLPPPLARFFCPMSEAELFRRTLRAGCRVIKVMTLMTLGPYEPPQAIWMPSVAY